MQIVRKGKARAKDTFTYKFSCRHCNSVLKAKRYELRDLWKDHNAYAFTCPVCNMQRIVYSKDIVPVRTPFKIVDDFLTDVVRDINRKERRKEYHYARRGSL